MLPLYLLRIGYNVLDVGILFIAVHLISIPLTYLISKLFDKIAIRHGLVIIDALDGIAYVILWIGLQTYSSGYVIHWFTYGENFKYSLPSLLSSGKITLLER